ncbi:MULTISPECIES: hypothetical protein [unclassified Colwellia]|uniref:hypothetical protein n=1 Tax=unclassified Colwellia TaxID=196834 RepID=UPI0015F4A36F|nr:MULTISPECIES: hypothetical protein [unclassified Colwellia]MBA6355190.1 hypothetical protein [Colwellia sp. BRX8-3]MBA6358822.1 hypothetical protein [Colwellia sp. BRX8-6]MBA6366336.1 hypothetical protein [Colwellia sp. BRX8-5]MBA6369941.1 hypothetical protein [Colwellia sp. BRX8-4]MBA6375493.1 hypothetical protein [Colwellia sp. BRX8-2]
MEDTLEFTIKNADFIIKKFGISTQNNKVCLYCEVFYITNIAEQISLDLYIDSLNIFQVILTLEKIFKQVELILDTTFPLYIKVPKMLCSFEKLVQIIKSSSGINLVINITANCLALLTATQRGQLQKLANEYNTELWLTGFNILSLKKDELDYFDCLLINDIEFYQGLANVAYSSCISSIIPCFFKQLIIYGDGKTNENNLLAGTDNTYLETNNLK